MKTDKPSNTALIVAAGLQLLPFDAPYSALLPVEAIRRGATLLAASHPRLAGLLRRAWFRTLCRGLERATLPGILVHYALRKAALREHARAAIAAGCRQVVVLGAGFDTLCMELQADHPPLLLIEVDHPATQASKRAALAGGAPGVHYLGAELGTLGLDAILAACPAYRRDHQTLFVAEGLLMYLQRKDVARLFGQMARAAAPASRIAFTWFAPQADGQPNFDRRSQLVDLWLRLRGEPFLSGQHQRDLPHFLAGCGFSLLSVRESVEQLSPVCRAALTDSALPIAGEYICFAHN